MGYSINMSVAITDCKTTYLESGIETIFLSLVRQKCFKNAIDCLSNRNNRVPSSEVISSLIFKVLMSRECDKKTAVDACMYLDDVLTIYPPSDCYRRRYYKSCLIDKNSKFNDLWLVFRHIVESVFVHYKIYRCDDPEFILYPHCDSLIDFYIKVFIESYDTLSNEKSFYDKSERSFVMDLFWPTTTSNISASKENARQFLQWINEIYMHSKRLSKIAAFADMQKLLNLMIKSIIVEEYDKSVMSTNVPDSLICNSLCLLDSVKVIFNICKEIVNSDENLRRFLAHVSSKALKLKLCEYKLYEMINSKQPSERKRSPCTLHTIVTAYMLPKKLNTGKKAKKQRAMSCGPVADRREKPTTIATHATNEKGESALHELCRTKRSADLYLSLISATPPDVNQVNNLGQTPLHIACLNEAEICVKILLDECATENSRQKISFSAADDEGLTSLHIAVQKNNITTAKQLLRRGGTKLLDATDKAGRKPFHYASKEMKQALKEFRANLDSDKPVEPKNYSFSDLDIPTFQNFKEYALFCHALNYLITLYMDIHNLYHVRKLMKSDSSTSVEILKHEEKVCPHFSKCGENAVCSEDYEHLKIFPDIISHFVKRTKENAREKELNLDMEVFPLDVLARTLD